MSTVAHLRPQEAVLTKQQLAKELGRSERWVELRVRDGMPSLPPTRRYATRRFILADVRAWLDDGQATVTRPVPDRLADLEREVVSLRSRIRELEESR